MFQSDESARQNNQREEDYERMYAKMGRDFVHIDDLRAWIEKIRAVLAPLGIPLPALTSERSLSQANEYKENIENGDTRHGKYKDLVEIDGEE